jgi:2-methylcitrate dehydratase
MIAVPLIHGRLTAGDYEDSIARDPASTRCATRWSASRTSSSRRTIHDPDKRSIANAITVKFKDGTKTKEIVVEYRSATAPAQGRHPVLIEKFRTNLARRFPEKQRATILCRCARREQAVRAAGARFRRHDGHLKSRPADRILHAPALPLSSPSPSRWALP